MKNIIKYIIAIIFILNATSCNTDFLNPEPEDRFGEAAVWKDPALVEAFVNEMYRGLNHGLRELMLGSLADESQFIHNYGSAQVVQSNLTSADVGSFSRGDFDEFNWTVLYRRIRQVNLFKEKIEEVPFVETSWKDRLEGEVHFLNAYFYHNLVRLYGGVPLVTKAYQLKDEFNIPRSSLQECIQYIVSECDLAASLLPLTYPSGEGDIGRATRGAALALKARILLYAASDLYNDPTWAGSFANPELISTTGARAEKWQAAKEAAKAVIDLGIYSLQNTGSPVKDYTDLFLIKDSKEAIFSRFFIKSRGWEDGALPGLANGPNGYHNWGGNTPIQELVDDYEMVDGTKFDWNNPTHANAPYENRDPRFAASILYDQAPWRPRPSDVKDIDPDGKIIIRSVETAPGVWTPGLDTRDGPIEDWNGGYSGYYLRKFIDPTVVHEYAAAGGNQEAPWHFLRYGEILLNYAEACIELNEDDEAKLYLNMLRERAGMPDITETGTALKDRYRNERRIELAFEQHRYFDIRRWMIAPQAMGRNANGIVIEDPLAGPVEYSLNKVQDRKWENKMYFLPISLEEINRNSELIQNPLY
ncbi:RagB/SusD family nutrient uptake outer membrane protein [Chryseolinea sp. H1M3-3]|uniref:RagB/SusD family nutrient uptake outer membrane protein n=1 Tax=Chryseolinea sp. H1M3-3 TaxID=3034144 RepID=UPI0023ED4D4C|nr:RagB/SusD family nutrient uptake outer membrane protein [Chryseolinea sp. H1M3-3]